MSANAPLPVEPVDAALVEPTGAAAVDEASAAGAPTRSAAPRGRDVLPRRSPSAVRPWSALVCGLDDDRTLLVVDWLLLACRQVGLVAQAVPLATSGDGAPHGMYVEVAGSEDVEAALGELPWGAVDLLVAGEHLELMRAIEAGYVQPEVTTVVASCRRRYTSVERLSAPEHVLAEREIDAAARAAARAYHAFDGHEVAGWYDLPATAQPGLLLGAICGTGATGLPEAAFLHAIDALGIDEALQCTSFGRGVRLGRRHGGRVRRVRTAYQFTRRRRALVDHRSRSAFEALVEQAEATVPAEHLPCLQEAVFRLCEFQDADWASRLLDHVAELAEAERASLGGIAPAPQDSIVGDAIRSLVALLVWPDAAWVANRKLRPGRLRDVRTAHGISRRDAYDLVDHVPLDAGDAQALRHPRLGRGTSDAARPALLEPLRVERIRTTTLAGALRLRRRAASARHRAGSARQRLELDTAELWLQAVYDALRTDHSIARIVARSGSLVQGSGAVRDAHRATAHAFWGRIVRQSIAIDRAGAPGGEPAVALRVVPFVWEQLCRSGPLALWEYAAPVLGIALAHARGVSHAETVRLADVLCEPRRPLEGS